VSTFDPAYNTTQRNLIIQNGYEGATLANGTLDSQWPTCMGCAVIARSLERTGTAMPDACNTCMERYCWNGTTDSRTPGTEYTPTFKTSEIKEGSAFVVGPSMFMIFVALASAMALM
jgi:lysophospholipase